MEFVGYITTVTKIEGGRLIETFDLRLKNFPDGAIMAPCSPLAAVGETLSRMGDPITFWDEKFQINVTDPIAGTVEVYGAARVFDELNMEVLAG